MNFSATASRAKAPTTQSAGIVVRRRSLPNRRAVIGGLLVAIAAVGALIAARGNNATTHHRVAVATHDVPAGATIAKSDVRYDSVEVADEVAPQLFADEDAPTVIGRTAATALSEGDLVAHNAVLDAGVPDPRPQLSLPVERARALDGLIEPGQTVDLLATFSQDGGQTEVVARGAEVLRVDSGSRTALNPANEVILLVAVASNDEAIAVANASQIGKVTIVRSGSGPS
jgi:Flp pilus assembly protein CpaB